MAGPLRLLSVTVHCLFFPSLILTFADPRAFNYKWDLPTERELNKYLRAVETVVNYSEHIPAGEVSIDFVFALFLVNVNMVHAVREKGRTIPESLNQRIQIILNNINNIINVYKRSRILEKRRDDLLYEINIALMSLFNNASFWSEKMEKFYFASEKRYTSDVLSKIYSPFSVYMEKVDKFENWIPTPDASDNCLASLTVNPANKGRSTPRCRVADYCYDVVKGGTDFGYALTHRMFLLLLARLNFGCAVFSERTDRAMVRYFCSMCHAEATYIAENNYQLLDLFIEIIALCAIDGHLQFLSRAWLDNIVKFQTPDGCYGAAPTGVNAESIRRSIVLTKMGKIQNITLDDCNQHTTGLAAAAFSAAVRFIIEEYY